MATPQRDNATGLDSVDFERDARNEGVNEGDDGS